MCLKKKIVSVLLCVQKKNCLCFSEIDFFLFVFCRNRTSLSETTPGKSSPSTPRVAKLSRAVNKSETSSPSSRLPLDRSSPSSKSSSVERRSPKVPTPPEVSVHLVFTF